MYEFFFDYANILLKRLYCRFRHKEKPANVKNSGGKAKNGDSRMIFGLFIPPRFCIPSRRLFLKDSRSTYLPAGLSQAG